MPREILVPIDVEFRSTHRLSNFRDRLAKTLDLRNKIEQDLERGEKKVGRGKVYFSKAERRRKSIQISKLDTYLNFGVGRIFLSVNDSEGAEIEIGPQRITLKEAVEEEQRWKRGRSIKSPTPFQTS